MQGIQYYRVLGVLCYFLLLRMLWSIGAMFTPAILQPWTGCKDRGLDIMVWLEVWAKSMLRPNSHRTRDATHANWNIFPLMLLVCSVNTPMTTGPNCLCCIVVASHVLCEWGLMILVQCDTLSVIASLLPGLKHMCTHPHAKPMQRDCPNYHWNETQTKSKPFWR